MSRERAGAFFSGGSDNDGRQQEYSLARATLAGDGCEARRLLMDRGLYIAPDPMARKLLNAFLLQVKSANRVRAAQRGGWHGSKFVLPATCIGSDELETFVLQGGTQDHAFRQAGTLDGWKATSRGTRSAIAAWPLRFRQRLLRRCWSYARRKVVLSILAVSPRSPKRRICMLQAASGAAAISTAIHAPGEQRQTGSRASLQHTATHSCASMSFRRWPPKKQARWPICWQTVKANRGARATVLPAGRPDGGSWFFPLARSAWPTRSQKMVVVDRPPASRSALSMFLPTRERASGCSSNCMIFRQRRRSRGICTARASGTTAWPAATTSPPSFLGSSKFGKRRMTPSGNSVKNTAQRERTVRWNGLPRGSALSPPGARSP